MLAVQLLSGRGPISVKQGLAFVAVMVAACAFAALLAQIFDDSPLVLLLAVSLLIFLEFLLLARGQAVGVAAIFLITTAVVPLLAIESMSVAYGLDLFADCRKCARGAADLCGARAFPHASTRRARCRPARRRASPGRRRARQYRGADEPCDLFHADSLAGEHRRGFDGHWHPSPAGRSWRWHSGRLDPGQPCRRPRRDRRLYSRHATSFPVFLLLVVLLVGLLFGDRIARGGELAPIYTVGLMTFLIVLGPWALTLAAGQRHFLHCPRLRRHGGGHLRHRHGQPVALCVSCFLIFASSCRVCPKCETYPRLSRRHYNAPIPRP